MPTNLTNGENHPMKTNKISFEISDLGKTETINSLKKNGYIIISNFFNEFEISKINKVIDRLEKYTHDNIKNESHIKIASTTLNYSEKSSRNSTLIDIRGKDADHDNGMVDIFNPEIWIKENQPELLHILDFLKSENIKKTISAIDQNLKPQNSNIYIHNSVTKPRCAHVDSNKPFIKIFCALTDHSIPGCGPLLIYPGSHKNKLLNKIMILLNLIRKTINTSVHVDDAFLYPSKNMIPLLMKPGDIAICNLTLVHSAMPASLNGYRRTFVQTYRS